MIAFSCLRPAFTGCCRLHFLLKAGNSCRSTLTRETKLLLPVRGMAGAAKVPARASGFQYHKFKDHVHFYFCLGLVPIGLIVSYSYIFIGPAELVDTPEGYEPKHWEYQSNPIKRFFARYVYENPAVLYEKQLDVLYRQNQSTLDMLFRDKVKKTMAERQDFRGYYFYTYDKSKIDNARKVNEKQKEEMEAIP